MRVAVVEDDATLRFLIGSILEIECGVEIVGDAAGVTDGTALMRATQPDVVVVDLHIDGGSGPDMIRALRKLPPSVKVVVYSGDARCEELAVAAGADAALSKRHAPQALCAVLRGFHDGSPLAGDC